MSQAGLHSGRRSQVAFAVATRIFQVLDSQGCSEAVVGPVEYFPGLLQVRDPVVQGICGDHNCLSTAGRGSLRAPGRHVGGHTRNLQAPFCLQPSQSAGSFCFLQVPLLQVKHLSHQLEPVHGHGRFGLATWAGGSTSDGRVPSLVPWLATLVVVLRSLRATSWNSFSARVYPSSSLLMFPAGAGGGWWISSGSSHRGTLSGASS